MENLVNEYFGDIHIKSAEPLFVRLEKALERYIRTLPRQTLLPPERELAAGLGVNRKTLSKAMEGLVNSGLLQRTKQGTVVQREDKSFSLEDIHPFVLNEVKQKTTLRILLCDNLPDQVEFWRTVASGYTMHSGIEVEYEWLPRSCSTINALRVYAEKGDFHLIQMSSFAPVIAPGIFDILDSFPKSLTDKMHDPAFRFDSYLSDGPELFEKLMPLYFSLNVLWFNRALADRYDIDLNRYSCGEESLIDLFNRAAGKLPPDIPAIDHLSTLSSRNRPSEITDGSIRAFYQSYLGVYEKVKGWKEHVAFLAAEAPYCRCDETVFREFASGNLFLMSGDSVVMNYLQQQLSFEPFITPMWAERKKECRRYPFSGMGLRRNCRYKTEAVGFLEYFLKPAVQQLLVEKLMVAPMLREADPDLWRKFSGDQKSLETILNGYRVCMEYDLSTRWNCQSQVRMLLEQKIGLPEAVNQAIEHFFTNN